MLQLVLYQKLSKLKFAWGTNAKRDPVSYLDWNQHSKAMDDYGHLVSSCEQRGPNTINQP